MPYRVTVHEGPTVPIHPDPTAPRGSRPRGWVALAAAVVVVVGAVGVWLLWRTFVDTWAGQSVEDAAYDGAAIGQGRLWRVAEQIEELGPEKCRVEKGAESLSGLAFHLVMLGFEFEVHEPKALIDELQVMSERLSRAVGRSA